MDEPIIGMYDKEFDFVPVNGEATKIRLKPLTGKDLRTFFKIIKFLDLGETPKELSQKEWIALFADSDLLADLEDVTIKSIKRSYPSWNDAAIAEFVAVNMFTLLPMLIEVNNRS